MLTFLPLEQIKGMENWQGAELNKAKEILAFELTSLVHGEEEATTAQQAAKALFVAGTDDANMPCTKMSIAGDSVALLDILVETKLCESRGEAKRLIQQGGISINDVKISAIDYNISKSDIKTGIKIKKGKKIFHKVLLQD
jgi:tyrosyl-tRNA synthetase